jgi:hypothetical protein
MHVRRPICQRAASPHTAAMGRHFDVGSISMQLVNNSVLEVADGREESAVPS